MTSSDQPTIEALVETIDATANARRDATRDERVHALADALRERLADVDPSERESLLDRIGQRFPRRGTTSASLAIPADPDAQRRIEELEAELAALREERDRLATSGGGDSRATPEFLVGEADPAGESTPTLKESWNADDALRESFQIMLRILEVLASNVNDSFTFVEARTPPFDVRKSLRATLEAGSSSHFEEDLKRLRRCLRALISHPFVFLQSWCKDMQEQFHPQQFLDRCRNKPAKAFEEFEDFMARTQFTHAVFPPLKSTLRSKLLDILKSPPAGTVPQRDSDDGSKTVAS